MSRDHEVKGNSTLTYRYTSSLQHDQVFRVSRPRFWVKKWFCRGFTLCCRFSKCHSHILHALAQPSANLHLLLCMSVLTFIKLASARVNSCNKSLKSGMHSGTSYSCTWRRGQNFPWNGSDTSIQSSAHSSSSAFRCWSETITWEDFVSVWLHHFDYNEAVWGMWVQERPKNW